MVIVRLKHHENWRITLCLALQVVFECSRLVGFDCFCCLEEKLFDLDSMLVVVEKRWGRCGRRTRSAFPVLGEMIATISIAMVMPTGVLDNGNWLSKSNRTLHK